MLRTPAGLLSPLSPLLPLDSRGGMLCIILAGYGGVHRSRNTSLLALRGGDLLQADTTSERSARLRGESLQLVW